ncbi:MAG TPA: efflux RND transporter periplasmic adaptor subunit [bacterium]|nr:efflux RND transporter periplasmic adaptor subunit [bacterium]
MRWRVVVVGVIFVLAVGGIMAWRGRGRAEPTPGTPAAAQSVPAAVVVATATPADVVSRVLASGSVTSIRDAKLGSKLSGRVAAVLVDEGARVSAGTPLLQLDTSDLAAEQAQAAANVAAARARLQEVLAGARPQERQQSIDAVNQAQAGLRSAQSSLDLAQTNLQRARSLFGQGAVSRQDLDSAQTQAQVAEAQVAQARAAYDSAVQNAALVHIGSREEDIQQARAQLAQAQAGLAAIQVQLRDSTITAPFPGTITQRNVEPGEVVSSVAASAQSPLFVLSEVHDVYVEFIVPQQHRGELRLGQQAQLAVDGLGGQTFAGQVEEITPGADVSSRTFGVKVRVPNPQGILRPGMFARGAIIVGVRHNVLQIPEQAVMTAASGPVVFVVLGGRAVHRNLTLGDHHDGLIEVVAGLAGGDTVVVQGQDGLTDNQPVAPSAPRP